MQGQLRASTTVAVNTGAISIGSYSVGLANVCSGLTTKTCASNADCTAGQGTCSVLGPGDNDEFADANELINLAVKFVNKSGLDVDDLTASLGTAEPQHRVHHARIDFRRRAQESGREQPRELPPVPVQGRER